MKKRIRTFLNEKESTHNLEIESAKEEDHFLKLLVSDLKKEAELMPKYSFWNEMVAKCLETKEKSH